MICSRFKTTQLLKKILIITYYWPPSGGGGVQRWLKFTKYLPENGWEPIIFTPENPDFELKDDSLFKDVSSGLEVIKFPIWEPFGIYKKLFGKTTKGSLKQGIVIEKSKMTLGDSLSIWIRANLFIPDPRRFWVNSSVKFLNDFVTVNDINHIVTTGPPHSMHLIGLGLKKHHPNIKWVADFRDPWSDWDILEKLKVSNWAYRIHRNLEAKVMENCDILLTVSKRLAQAFEEKERAKKVVVITNGVDESDFKLTQNTSTDRKFRITHMGLLNEIRNPLLLWKALEELCHDNDAFANDLEIVLAGMVSGSILTQLKENDLLKSKVNFMDYLSHEKVFEQYKDACVLLLLLNQTNNSKWILPGKLYEYMFAKKSILCLGEKDSDVNDILKETKTGILFNPNDKEGMKTFILTSYANYKNKSSDNIEPEISKYTRKNLTKNLAKLLDNLN